jgi:hypothetical protein
MEDRLSEIEIEKEIEISLEVAKNKCALIVFL